MVSEARVCFVVMPFSSTASATGEQWTEIFETLFKPAVEAAGYVCRRSSATRGSLIKGIVEDLDAAWVVLADLTDQNPNVFYELGVRHALQDRTIIVAQARSFIPSDIRDYANHVYRWDTDEGRADFALRVTELLQDVDRDPHRADNPISDFLGSLRPREHPLALAARLEDVETRLQAFEGALEIFGRSGAADAPTQPALHALRETSILAVEPAPASWLDAAQEIAAAEDVRTLRRIVRTAGREIREAVPAKVVELNVRQGDRVSRASIPGEATEYQAGFAPIVANVEQFAMGLAGADWAPGGRAILDLAGALISAGEGLGGVRFAIGLPAYYAWRLVLVSGAASVQDEAFATTKTLVNEPISVTQLSGRRTFRDLSEHRDLFYPEALLGYADLGIKQVAAVYPTAGYFEQVFGSQEDFNTSLAEFLILVALRGIVSEHEPVYPGYRLLEGFPDARGRLIARIRTQPDELAAIAAVLGLTSDDLLARWQELATAANEPALGPGYFGGARLPTDITADIDTSDDW